MAERNAKLIGYQFYNATLPILPSLINFTGYHKIIATMNQGQNREQEQEEVQKLLLRAWDYPTKDNERWSAAELYFAKSFEVIYKDYREPLFSATRIGATVVKLINFVVGYGGLINLTRRYANTTMVRKLADTRSHSQEKCLGEFADKTYKSQLTKSVEYVVK
ncbi:hypothetical protein HYFRA_00004350 [Hymenoscyphus fraxineus]|uniref:Uncharacterized protein n=1 Tax=Hymenoscyphus fraxineus TaxID=746836 RepID=A0A9N9PKK6_9HELO|nr:hypothetical protein HYFRA_00004350 [Hymenoscyphus fraxineus]